MLTDRIRLKIVVSAVRLCPSAPFSTNRNGPVAPVPRTGRPVSGGWMTGRSSRACFQNFTDSARASSVTLKYRYTVTIFAWPSRH